MGSYFRKSKNNFDPKPYIIPNPERVSYYKNILMIFITVIMISCSSCGPTKVTIDDTSMEQIAPEPESDIHGGSPVPEVWEECSGHIGDHPCDLSLVDQFGDTFQLYDNYGKIILLDFSAMWCGPCNIAAGHSQQFMDEYGDKGFLWVTILIENQMGSQPTEDDIKSWSDTYGITTSPVLSGDRTLIDPTGDDGWPVGAWPTFVILDKDMVIKNGMYGWSEEIIKSWVEAEI